MQKRLTQMVACAGWASKLAAGELAQVLSDIPVPVDDRVLIDFRTADDAGVYRWEAGPALVQTVDFFTPIVDDPYLYGEIAAANSVSDVYAMGGRPLTALAIAAFPSELDADTIRRIFIGGSTKLREAGVALLGGHTVQDPEIKFGYAVTGAVDPARVLSNAGARAGDALFLTKPLGTGIIGTAIKHARAPQALIEEAAASMRTLNRAAAEALSTVPAGSVHACTDITGFGLVGHGTEMARASGVSLELSWTSLPVFSAAIDLAPQNRSGGQASNEQYFGGSVAETRKSDDLRPFLYDPQTSGGLLIAVAAEQSDVVADALRGAGVRAWRIGQAVPAIPHVHIRMV